MDFKTEKNIDVRDTSNEWGPFRFNFTNAIPSGETISSVDVKGYVGIIRPQDTDTPTEITSFVESSPVVASPYISVRLQYPGVDYKNSKATLVFTVTYSGGGSHPFYFHHVNIR